MMATRESMDKLIQQCEDAIRFAQDQYEEGRLQAHYNDEGYTYALQSLENAYNDLAKMALSSNAQQREQLHRMRLQLQQLQNQMIILPHE
jgi:phage shock protein A